MIHDIYTSSFPRNVLAKSQDELLATLQRLVPAYALLFWVFEKKKERGERGRRIR